MVMFELPEMITFARQMNQALAGKVVLQGSLGNSPHKFVWYNRTPDEFAALTRGKRLGAASSRGRWLFLPLEPGYVLVLGECGGRILYHPTGEELPKKYHLFLKFEEGSALSATTQMWGAMELYEQGQELNRQYIRGMRPAPLDPAFTFEYFAALVGELSRGEKRSAKGLLTQEQLIPGLGNSIAQDVLFRAGLHPKHPIDSLNAVQQRLLYEAIQETAKEVIAQGGRSDETDLFNHPGGYLRIMDKDAAGQPCPVCGAVVEKIQYLGGACYFCPRCQE
jgi:formamidopyrimidine-DNA glycosylase